jgi:hypothetical protein
MWPTRMDKVAELDAALEQFSRQQRALPGIAVDAVRRTLALQMVASLRRLDYTLRLKQRPIDPARADPNSDMFDPERAAILHARAGDLDEAFWVIFLATHFGKHGKHGWRRMRDLYSGLGGQKWTWARYSADPREFRSWLAAHGGEIGGAFGNHRKYESLRADSPKGTATVLEGYVAWVGCNRSHQKLVREMVRTGGNDPSVIFDRFYRGMVVKRFGRLGKFDFLALVGRLDLAPITPGSAYLKGATGPMRGARLLFSGKPETPLKADQLDEWLRELNGVLDVGMQVMEDSLCNWQKSPRRFIHFKG